MTEQIPTVDLRDFTSDDPTLRARFVTILGEGLERFGFVNVRGHGIDLDLLERAYGVARETFALPDTEKRRYETPADGRQRGYTSFGVEHAKDNPNPDLKEFWHIGRDLGHGHPLHHSGDIPYNQFPSAVPAFAATFQALFDAQEDFAMRLLDAVALYLGVQPDFFRRMTRDGNSVLRVIHYPDLGVAPVPGSIRAAQHEDINLMTVLPASTRPGLELMTRDGHWLAIESPPDVMVCDTGDMMQLLTAGRLPATTHRVVNPEGADGGRLSMPFFLHPHPDWLLQPADPAYGEAIEARDYLQRRLKAIGVA